LTLGLKGYDDRPLLEIVICFVSNIETHNTPIVLLLAGGLSARMGTENKLLLRHKGRALITHSAELFRRHFPRVYIVTGFEADRLKAACGSLDVDFIHNPDFEDGLGASFRAGVLGVPDIKAPMLVALADQIFLQDSDIETVITAYREQGGEKVIIPYFQGQRGHPVMFPPAALAVIRSSRPVMTGRCFIQTYPQDCHYTVMKYPHCILDVDTPADARQHLRPDEDDNDRP